MEEDPILTNLKILIIGESGVGKSSLLLRFTDDQFDPDQEATIGVDFKVKVIDNNGNKVKLAIWDTAGQERFRSLTTAFFRDAMGFILMFDVTSDQSLMSTRDWLDQLTTHAYSETPDIVLCGNKVSHR